jgi:hypothetical protein
MAGVALTTSIETVEEDVKALMSSSGASAVMVKRGDESPTARM